MALGRERQRVTIACMLIEKARADTGRTEIAVRLGAFRFLSRRGPAPALAFLLRCTARWRSNTAPRREFLCSLCRKVLNAHPNKYFTE